MSATSGETSKLNLLVVDDERLIADSLAWILNLRGFNARSVYSGTEAIDHAAINPIDILVSVPRAARPEEATTRGYPERKARTYL